MMKIQHVQRWKHSSKQTYKKRIFEKNRKGRAAGKAAFFFVKLVERFMYRFEKQEV